MPHTALPPTPASSTDITGQDGIKQSLQLQMAFELPPAAMGSRRASLEGNNMNTPNSPESQASPKTPFQMQPSEAVKSRRRPSAATAANRDNSFALPPPPTRSRKIIQMKPRARDEKSPGEQPTSGKGSVSSTKRATATSATAEAAPGAATKKKKSSTTSAAGRKTARKTAHSLIERRRRSKMNEEFSVLKDMIPACTGEMHKLAILQASIDYVRYLHDCIDRLKSHGEASQTPTGMGGVPTPPDPGPYSPEQQHRQADRLEEQHSPDVEMTGSDAAPQPSATSVAYQPYTSTTTTTTTTASHQPPLAPASPASLDAWDSARRHGSYSSVSSAAATTSTATDHHHHQRNYSYSGSSAAASPAFGPQTGGCGGYGGGHSASGSTLTSPALGPLWDRDFDQEATAALLLLSSSGRKETGASVGGNGGGAGGGGRTARGMSVRDLLSA